MKALYVLALAGKRLRSRSSGALLAALGLAIGTAVVSGVLVGGTVAKDRSTSQAVERLPDATRSVRAVWFGVPAGPTERYPALDVAVRRETARLPLGRPVPIVLFRESTVAGRFAGLAAVDGVETWVELRSGRLPRMCRPEHCEVLRLRGAGRIPNAPGLRLVEVGSANLRSRQLFGDFLTPTDNALADAQVAEALRAAAGYHRPPPGPLLLAEGVTGLAASPRLAAMYRSYAWVWPLRSGTPRLWQIDELARGSDRARAALAAVSPSFSVLAPLEELRAAERAATVTGRRLLLVGGEAAALLVAFAVLAAGSLRRDLEAARRRLTWFGARRWQLALLPAAESAAVGVCGAALGWIAGVAVGAVAAERAGAPVGAVLRESVFAPAGALVAFTAAFSAAVVLALAVSVRPRLGARFGPIDAAAAAAGVGVAVALLGGTADEERLSRSEGAGIVLLLVPGLIAFVAAVLAARLHGPLARAVGRAARRRLELRLAAVSLARGSGAAAVTVAFLVLAFALALLAEGYRSTLARAEVDQAAYRVPLDVLIREDLTRLVEVQDAAPLEHFAELAPRMRAVPVLRLQGGAGAAEGVTGVTVLGLPAAEVPRLRLWRDDWAPRPRSELASLLAPPGNPRQAGLTVGRALELTTSAGIISFSARLLTADGRFHELSLGAAPSRGTATLQVPVPTQLRGARLVAIDLVLPRIQERGADAGTALRGSLRLTGLPLGGWLGVGGVNVVPRSGGVEVRYTITPERTARLRPRQPTDGRPPSVLATPRLAALAGGTGGTLPLQIAGERIPVRVAGVVQRFPSTRGEAVVGDVDSLTTAINTAAPGGARVNEVWLAFPRDMEPAVAAALARPPFRALETVSRRALESDARRDPLAHGTLLALVAAALVALTLAALGLALTVLADLRDEGGELFDLEAQGAQPSFLRGVVWARTVVVALAGLVAGALAGLLLAALVTRVVSVTARAASPEPPLALSFDARIVAVAVALYVVVAAGLVGLAVRGAFRNPRGPARTSELGG